MKGNNWAETVKLRRLLLWFGLTELISVIYPLTSLAVSGPPGDAMRWFSHNATFSIFHHSAFAVAVGLFAATARNVFTFKGELALPRRWYQAGVVGLLIVLVSAAVGIAVLDAATHGGLLPPYLDNESRSRAYALEGKIRGDDGVKLTEAELRSYQELIGWTTQPRKVRLRDGNSLAIVSVIIDCVFGAFIAVFFWYVVVASLRTYLEIEDHRGGTLVAIFACLCLWFPLRIYATWYERHFFEQEWLSGYSALNFMLILFFVVGSLIALLLVRNTTAAWISGGVSLLAGGLAMVSKLNPDLFGGVAKSVERLHPFHLMVLWFLILIVLAVFVVRVIHDLGQPENDVEEPAESSGAQPERSSGRKPQKARSRRSPS